MDKEIEVWCSLHSDELIDSLVSLDYDDLLLFIK